MDMSNDDFKKILNEAIKPLSDAQEEFRKDLSGVKEDLSGVKEDLSGVKEDQADLRRIIEERVLHPLVYIETTVKSYADRYVINEDHIGRLDKRLKKVEDNLGIQPAQELTIPSFD